MDMRVGNEVLLVRTHAGALELPEGGIEWDETAEMTAARQVREVAGVRGSLRARRHLGDLDYFVEEGGRRVLKRVRYYLLNATGNLEMIAQPVHSRERAWIERNQLESISLVRPELRPVVSAALEE
jgi:ADP-ribose pyrophosphatase YjhB (NUDIX family)